MRRGFHGDDDGTEAEEASLRLEPEDVLEDHSGANLLELGYSPEDRPWAVDDWGTTASEQASGESLAGRLARELPDYTDDDDAGDGLGDVVGTDGELRDNEVGGQRAGRLRDGGSADDAGEYFDTEPELLAWDEGVDGGAASAEEAAVHMVPDAQPRPPQSEPAERKPGRHRSRRDGPNESDAGQQLSKPEKEHEDAAIKDAHHGR